MNDYSTYGYVADEAAGSMAMGAIGFVLVFYLFVMAFAVVVYVLQSLGMYTIAKRRGIHHPWLSWIPVGNMWILGSISDQYQYVAKGRIRNRRKLLTGLSIGMFALLIPIYVSLFALMFSEATGGDPTETLLGATILIVLLAYLAIVVIAILALVFQYIALYDLFASCDPGNSVLYLVLSILINVTLPFFIFAVRKKDMGMSPVQTTQPQQPVQLQAPVAEAVTVAQAAPVEAAPVQPEVVEVVEPEILSQPEETTEQ